MIQQIITMLVLICVCFFAGMTLQRHLPNHTERLRLVSSQFSLLFIIPFAVANSLWQMGDIDLELLVVPLLGLGVIGSGALTSILIGRFYSLTSQQFSGLLPVTSFYNLGALGALFAFVFFGEDGVALVAIFKLFEEAVYFGIIFPYCRSKGLGSDGPSTRFWKNPVFIVSMSALIIGLILGAADIHRPEPLTQISQVLIPIGSLLLVFSAGLTFHMSGSQQWFRTAAVTAVMRIVIGVLFLTAMFWTFDLWAIGGGILFPLCVMLACMPCGFIGVLPARLYNLDTALANTAWLATYIASLIVGIGYFLLA